MYKTPLRGSFLSFPYPFTLIKMLKPDIKTRIPIHLYIIIYIISYIWKFLYVLLCSNYFFFYYYAMLKLFLFLLLCHAQSISFCTAMSFYPADAPCSTNLRVHTISINIYGTILDYNRFYYIYHYT